MQHNRQPIQNDTQESFDMVLFLQPKFWKTYADKYKVT